MSRFRLRFAAFSVRAEQASGSGRVVVLMAKGTRDGQYWISDKEKTMK